MKLSHGERTGLWAGVLGYIAFVALWVVVAPTEDDWELKWGLYGLAIAVALVTFIVVERRLPSLRGSGPAMSSVANVVSGVGGFLLIWWLVSHLPAGADTSRYYEARWAITGIAAVLSTLVAALIPPPPKPGSWVDRLDDRLARLSNLISEGRALSREEAAPPPPPSGETR